jgi:hypothetical protein
VSSLEGIQRWCNPIETDPYTLNRTESWSFELKPGRSRPEFITILVRFDGIILPFLILIFVFSMINKTNPIDI